MLKTPFRILIKAYKLAVSPYLPSNCRFQPTCSNYALAVLDKFGIFKALYLIVVRLIKCNPFHPGGIDKP